MDLGSEVRASEIRGRRSRIGESVKRGSAAKAKAEARKQRSEVRASEDKDQKLVWGNSEKVISRKP